MIKSALFFCLIFFLFPVGVSACSCGHVDVVDRFQNSGFVAKAKIIKITPDPTNREYHDAIIEIIKLYKGKPLSKIKVLSSLNTSCGFLPDENSTWLIFAQVWQEKLSFGFCSGSMQVDRVFDSAEYPNAAKNWGNTIKLREGVLSFLSDHNIFSPNPFQLRAYNAEINSFKGYKNENSFSVFQVDVNADFSIANIKQLKKFQNKKLNNLLFNSMKKYLKFGGKRGTPLTNPIRVVLFCYYYKQNGSDQSFLSFIDV